MLALRSTAALCLASAVTLAFVLPAQPASATKKYARAEGKDCSHCHVDPDGSGPRNENGREYEANGHQFGVESWSTPENKLSYLRARSALMATWYGETGRLLGELEKTEELPGGLALIVGTRKRFKMFPNAWSRSAKKLLDKGDRGVPNALVFLTKLESQFPASDQGKAAVAKLDELAANKQHSDAVTEARAVEVVRVTFLQARTELELGEFEKAKPLFESVLGDERGADFHADARELMDTIPAD